MSKLWRFQNSWDYHALGGFLVHAPSAKSAAKTLNEWLASRDSRDHQKHNYFPGAYDKPKAGTWTAQDADEIGPVYVEGGCDD